MTEAVITGELSACTRDYKIAVIKIGSSTITNGEGKVDRAYMADLAYQVHKVRSQGWRPIIVSSGSIPCGLEALGLPLKRPRDMSLVQAAASVGQRALSAAYDQVFSPYDMLTSLVLLTRRDTADRTAYLNARATLRRLVDLNVVPIVNENDTVSVEQIKFGDNDTLAALVACLVEADRVVLLSDIDGLYTANPHSDPDAKLIHTVDRITPAIIDGATGAGSVVGSGGMSTKIKAARVLAAAGIPMVICHGRAESAVARSLEETPLGTLFSAKNPTHEISARKLWIALGDSVKARIVVDAGAADALISQGSSLLSVGVHAIEGAFGVSDVVDVVDLDGYVIARGLVRVASEDVTNESGVVIHRDELVVFE